MIKFYGIDCISVEDFDCASYNVSYRVVKTNNLKALIEELKKDNIYYYVVVNETELTYQI